MQHVHIHITGIVQGVGMRPFVYREAAAHGIGGWVLNAGDGVHIEAHGESNAVTAFIHDLQAHAPAASRIDAIAVTELDLDAPAEFDPGVPGSNARAAKTGHSGDAAEHGAPTPVFRIIASEDETAHSGESKGVNARLSPEPRGGERQGVGGGAPDGMILGIT